MLKCFSCFLAILSATIVGCSGKDSGTSQSQTAKPNDVAETAESSDTNSRQHLPSSNPGKYEVRFHIPAEPGDLRNVEILAQQTLRRTVKKGEQVLDDNVSKTRIVFAGEVKTLEVDDTGRETRTEITVDQFSLFADKQKEVAVLDKGAVVIAQSDGDTTTFARKGKGPLSAEASHLLPTLLCLNLKAEEILEAASSKGKRQAVGSEWPLRNELVVKTLQQLDPGVNEDLLSGRAKLLGVESKDGVDHIDSEVTLSYDQPSPTVSPLPNTVPESAALQFRAAVKYPADYATSWVELTSTLEMQQVLVGKQGTSNEGLTFDARSTETVERRRTYVGK